MPREVSVLFPSGEYGHPLKHLTVGGGPFYKRGGFFRSKFHAGDHLDELLRVWRLVQYVGSFRVVFPHTCVAPDKHELGI